MAQQNLLEFLKKNRPQGAQEAADRLISAGPQVPDMTTEEDAMRQLEARGVRTFEGQDGSFTATRGPIPSEVKMDLSGLPTRDEVMSEGTGLTPERFAGLSPDAQSAIQPPVPDPNDVTMNVGGGSVTVPPSLASATFGQDRPLAPMGQEATRARIGELFGTGGSPTLNQAMTGQEGAVMDTDPQGRMRSFESPEARAQSFADSHRAFEDASAARQANIGGTGSFAGDSMAREARLSARDPSQGETQTQRDTRIADSRTQGGASVRDAAGMTQGDRRNILRAQGVGGSGQVAAARQMGNQTNMDAMGEATDVPERERRVGSLMDTMGISRREALGLVEGTTKIQSDPTTGNAVIVDMVTGSTKPIDMSPDLQEQMGMGAQAGATDQSDPSRSLFEMAKQSTGVWNSLKTIGQRATGQVGVKLGDAPEVVEMRQNISNAQQQLVRALSVNPRFPVSEQERIRKEVDISPSAWNDPVTIESKMRGVDEALRERLDDEVKAHQNKSLPRNTRQAALQAANDISNFLELLGVPEEDEDSSSSSDIESIAQKYL